MLARDVETERLWLRTIGPIRTLLMVAPFHRDAELMAGMMLYSAPASFWKWIAFYRRPNNVNRFTYAIVPKGHRKPVGVISMQLKYDGWGETHLAIFDRDWRGQQVSVEARAALLDLFFERTGVTYFESGPNSRNLGSVFVYKKLGFRVIGAIHGKQRDHATDQPVDQVRFILTREDWERQKKQRDQDRKPLRPELST